MKKIVIGAPIETKEGGPIDIRHRPWASKKQVLANIPKSKRYTGLEVLVRVSGKNTKMWWKEGVENDHLVEFVSSAPGGNSGNTEIDEEYLIEIFKDGVIGDLEYVAETNSVDLLLKDGTRFPALLPEFATPAQLDELEESIPAPFVPAATPVTHSELSALVSAEDLVPGRFYKLTDYQLFYKQPVTGTLKSGSEEPLLLFALSASELSTKAVSYLSPEDEILYSHDYHLGGQYFFGPESGGGGSWQTYEAVKGTIYYRKDRYNNVAPYDTKAVLFSKDGQDYPTFGAQAANNTIMGHPSQTFGRLPNIILGSDCTSNTLSDSENVYIGNGCTNNELEGCKGIVISSGFFNKLYVSNDCTLQSGVTYSKLNGCDRVAITGGCDFNEFLNCDDVIVQYGPSYNRAAGSSNLTIRFHAVHNFIDSSNNVLLQGASHNTINEGCNVLTLGYGSDLNTFGKGCTNNTFGNDCRNNVFGNGCADNVIGYTFLDCKVGDGFSDNTIGNDAKRCTFGKNFQNNVLNHGAEDNVFGNNCSGNTMGYSFNGNTILDNTVDETFADGFQNHRKTPQGTEPDDVARLSDCLSINASTPVAEDDDEAAVLLVPHYGIYVTSTGEVRYKLAYPVTPNAPTDGVVDDPNETFQFTGGTV